MRLFVAVDPSPEVCERIEHAALEIRGSSPGSKWVKPGGHHITLAFLGEVDDARLPDVASAVKEAAARRAPLTLRVKGCGSFGKPRRPRVLWACVEGDVGALAAIQKDVEASLAPLGFTPEDRSFTPHITLARAKAPAGDPGLALCADAVRDRDFGETRVAEVIVYKSELSPAGARYTAVARAPLEST